MSGLFERQGESFAVGDADEERADEAGALSDGDGVEIGERDFRLLERFADDRDDLAEMFAGGELGDDAAVFAMDVDLRGDDAGENAAAVGDDGCGGFVAGRFDAENQFSSCAVSPKFLSSRRRQRIIVTYAGFCAAFASCASFG